MSRMSELDSATNYFYAPDLWGALGALLRICMNAAEGAESHGLADCTDWLTEIGDALQGMNGSRGPYKLTVEDLAPEDLNFDDDHLPTNVGDGYAVNGKSLQAICAAGRITLCPVRPDQCPEIVAEVLMGGVHETLYYGFENEVVSIDDGGRRHQSVTHHHSGGGLEEIIADDICVRYEEHASRKGH